MNEPQTTDEERVLDEILLRSRFTQTAREILVMEKGERRDILRRLFAEGGLTEGEQALLRLLSAGARQPPTTVPAPRRAQPVDRARQIQSKFEQELEALLKDEANFLLTERGRTDEHLRSRDGFFLELMRAMENALHTMRTRWQERLPPPARLPGPDHTESIRQLRLLVAELMDTVDAATRAVEDRDFQLQSRAVAALQSADPETRAAAMPVLRELGIDVVTDTAESPDLFDPAPQGQAASPAYVGSGQRLIARGRAPVQPSPLEPSSPFSPLAPSSFAPSPFARRPLEPSPGAASTEPDPASPSEPRPSSRARA